MSSSKRKNRSRWDSPRSARPPQPSAPASAATPPAVAAPPSALTSPSAARNRSPTVAAPGAMLSDFSLDYRYEFSVPAKMMLSRLERQPWLDPLSDYAGYSAPPDPTGYSLQGRRYGPLAGDTPSQLEDYSSINHSSKALQHYVGAYQNDKAELSSQLLPGLASEASHLDLERDRWRAAALARQNPSLYSLPSGPGDLGQPLPLGRAPELSSGRALEGGTADAKIVDAQANSTSLIGGKDILKGRDTTDKLPTGLQDPKLYCNVCDRAFPTAHQKEAHLQSHVKCEEEHCKFEATARKVKEHMLAEHGKQYKNAARASAGMQKEAEGALTSENHKNTSENADKTQNNEYADARAELVARKSRENRNYRLPGRYFPY